MYESAPIGPTLDQPPFLNAVLELEGKQSNELEEAVEATCGDCLGTATPIYNGLTGECVPGAAGVGALRWTPVLDPTACDPADQDLQERLRAEKLAAGDPVTIGEEAVAVCEALEALSLKGGDPATEKVQALEPRWKAIADLVTFLPTWRKIGTFN